MLKIITILFLITLFILFSHISYAQSSKARLSIEMYNKWPTLSDPKLSNNGAYVMYNMNNKPLNSTTLFIRCTNRSWKREFLGVRMAHFSEDSKFLYFKVVDTLHIVELGTNNARKVICQSFSVLRTGKEEVLIFQYNEELKKVGLMDFKKNAEVLGRVVGTISNYYHLIKSNKLLLVSNNNARNTKLEILDLTTFKLKNVFTDFSIENLTINNNEDALTFKVKSNDQNTSPTELWSLNLRTGEKIRQAIDNSGDLLGFELSNILRYSNDGKKLFVYLKETQKKLNSTTVADVDIWSYKDQILQSEQLAQISQPRIYLAVINLTTKKVVRLENKRENITLSKVGDDRWVIKAKNILYPGLLQSIKYSIVSTENGKEILLKNRGEISPNGRFVVCFDPDLKDYIYVDTLSWIPKRLTMDLSVNWDRADVGDADNFLSQPRGIAGWVGEHEILIYDQFDIWKLDLNGNKSPVNLTGGYGKSNKIVFTILDDTKNIIFKKTDDLILVSFGLLNKENGFFSKGIDEKSLLKKLSMGPYLYWNPNVSAGNDPSVQQRPIRARNKSVFVVQRMTAKDYPNYFVTRDLRSFSPISNLHPNRAVNWLTTELYTWNTADGKKLQGVLYKPEDFDPKKKYPVIFTYYRKKSENLNVYIKPECEGCTINIPTYVSNGYLVFTPDISFDLGKTGESAVSALTSAVDYLTTLPFVNAYKLGINGCSFGGFLTNYLVTHANFFAAACSASGHYDLVGGYGSLMSGISVKHGMFEHGPYQMGNSLWESPHTYIESSAIFNADKITTPFLMMQTPNDGTIPVAEPIAFYSALRRLNKKVWMLQYNNNMNHGVYGLEGVDFAIRMKQFFDHYLKDVPPPKWMTQGRSVDLKGIDNKLGLDTSGTMP